ncbi:type II toxin-antitoxin system PemK/MazF family toxin [Candidatus Poribacteria bacterium]|nr:type II toxin-antitoxin system PemK/MazF family toxin [Candidatus Poribacteria bacterium]
MTVKRGEIWLANLNPTRGSEQAGIRPVLIFQNDVVSKFTTTVLAIPLTTNLRRASLPSCVQISKGEGGLASDSVGLCHQLRVLDKTRLQRKLGMVSQGILSEIESCALFTMGMV